MDLHSDGLPPPELENAPPAPEAPLEGTEACTIHTTLPPISHHSLWVLFLIPLPLQRDFALHV